MIEMAKLRKYIDPFTAILLYTILGYWGLHFFQYFRIKKEANTEKAGIYFFVKYNQIQYIGITDNLKQRLQSHKKYKQGDSIIFVPGVQISSGNLKRIEHGLIALVPTKRNDTGYITGRKRR